MVEISQYDFSFKEVVETLVRTQGLHEGLWQLTFHFGIAASNVGPSDAELKPSAIVPIIKISLLRVEKENNLTVDAAKVNPP